MSKFLFGEATNIEVNVQNRIPHQALDNMTLEEVLTSVKPMLDFLGYLVSSYNFMCQRIRGISWKPPERKVRLLDIVKTLKHLEYIYLVKRKLSLAGI